MLESGARENMGGEKRTVGVEDACDADVDAVLAVVPVGQGFCDPLALVVAGTRADWVDVTPTSEHRSVRNVGSGRCTY